MVILVLRVVVDPGEPEPRTLSGPRRNVSIPEELAEYLGVDTGDKVYLMVNPDRPGTVVLLTAAGIRDVVMKGWTSI
jgi:ABC-type lipoprotein release transport system permease subunit